MKKSFYFLILILLSVGFMQGCAEKENQLPTCEILGPAHDDIFEIGQIVIITVESNDQDGNVAEVQFYVDNSSIGLVSTSPYKYNWNTTGLEEGNHTIKVVSKDNEGAFTSDVIVVALAATDAGICPSAIVDYDGNSYKTVLIGTQCWMSENLYSIHYANGIIIPNIRSNIAWGELTDSNNDDAYCFYDNNTDNASPYGALYTWASAMGDNAESSNANPSGVQGVCPDGWHMPSDAEWLELTEYLGGSSIAGGKMKEAGTKHWYSPNSGADNSSGFNACPGGFRFSSDGSFFSLGYNGYWWSSTESINSLAWFCSLYYSSSEVGINHDLKSNGYSVRCLKD